MRRQMEGCKSSQPGVRRSNRHLINDPAVRRALVWHRQICSRRERFYENWRLINSKNWSQCG